jgi:YhcH/YjgK/YiaL family protein
MILDQLGNSARYLSLHPSFPAAFAWLAAFDPATPDGKVELDAEGTVAIVQRYTTAPASEKKWETHRVHGDIQVLYSGSERIGYHPRSVLAVKTPYDSAKDAEFYHPPASSSLLGFPAGTFAIFFPEDGHQPGVMTAQPEEVLKVVVKFRV